MPSFSSAGGAAARSARSFAMSGARAEAWYGTGRQIFVKAAGGALLSGHEPPGLSTKHRWNKCLLSTITGISPNSPTGHTTSALHGAGMRGSVHAQQVPASHLHCCQKTCMPRVLRQAQRAAPCPLRSWAGRRRSARAAQTPAVRLCRQAGLAGPARTPAPQETPKISLHAGSVEGTI